MLLWINGPFGGGKTQRTRLRQAAVGIRHIRFD